MEKLSALPVLSVEAAVEGELTNVGNVDSGIAARVSLSTTSEGQVGSLAVNLREEERGVQASGDSA